MKKILFLLAFVCLMILLYSCQSSAGFRVVSPDEALEVSVSKDSSGLYVYSFAAQGEELIASSRIGFEGKHQGMIPGADWSVSSSVSNCDGVWKPVWGKRREVKDQYNELILSFKAPDGQQDINQIQVVFRVYNDGAAFRSMIPPADGHSEDVVSASNQYNLAGDYKAWLYNGDISNLGPEIVSVCE